MSEVEPQTGNKISLKLQKSPYAGKLAIRHFKALLHTNYLSYRRQIPGTIAEIVLPVAIIFLLSLLRLSVLPIYLDNLDLY